MRKRRLKGLVLPFALAALAFSLLTNRPVDYGQIKVTKVVDGDTVELSNGRRVRYIGIDTPELERKTPTGWQEVKEPFGKEAKQLNEALVLGKTVRLVFDAQAIDKYNRLLAYCFVSTGDKEVFVQTELLRNGLAYLYTAPPNIKYVDTMVAAYEEAKAKKAGLWSLDLEIDSREAVHFIGQRKLVLGQVKRSRATAKVITLTIEGLRVVIFKKDLGLFEKHNIDPLVYYRDKKVSVFGLVKEYKGEPEIIISNPWQIEITG